MKRLVYLLSLVCLLSMAAHAGPSDGLVNLWKFDETTGTTAAASVGTASWTGITGGSWGAG